MGPARAQDAVDPASDPGQVVGLFVDACLRYAGEPQALRAWIATYHLPQLPDDQASIFLGGRAGQAFGASTASGKHALDSFDDGACEVVVQADDPATVQAILLAKLAGLGVSMSPAGTQSQPDGSSTQYLYKATLNSRRWVISLTAKPPEAPGMAPELRLVATSN
jgi:hypothetical protein